MEGRSDLFGVPKNAPQAAIWQGYHDNWVWVSAVSGTFADPTATTTNNFIESLNNNFGKVFANASNLPGIVFTPAYSGAVYEIQAKLVMQQVSTGRQASVRMWDGATVIDDIPLWTGTTGASAYSSVTLGGFYKAKTGSLININIQMADSTGSSKILPGTGSSTIIWQIKQIL